MGGWGGGLVTWQTQGPQFNLTLKIHIKKLGVVVDYHPSVTEMQTGGPTEVTCGQEVPWRSPADSQISLVKESTSKGMTPKFGLRPVHMHPHTYARAHINAHNTHTHTIAHT